MQDDETIDDKEVLDQKSIDVKSLLDAVNSSKFDESETLLRGKDSFEKAESFFDLIKSDNELETKTTSETDRSLPESGAEEILEDKLDGDLNQKGLKDELDEENKVQPVEEKETDLEAKNPEALDTNDSQNESLDANEMGHSDQKSDSGFETVDVVSEVLHSGPEEKDDENDHEISQEQSEEYQKGYQDALIEFEKTLETEKKAVADFAKTLFFARDDLSEQVEEILIEKAQEIGFLFLGDRIDTVPELLIERVKKVTAEIIEKTSETIVELNEIDATAFIENLSELPFKVIKKPDLRRGEFRIIAGKSGYQQKISN